MTDLSYGYANARIKAMETCLLSEAQHRDLYNVGTLPEMTVMLQETAYKESLVHASQRFQGAELILNGLQDNLVATLRKLEDVLPPKARGDYAVLIGEWEVQDIKTIVAKKALGREVKKEELVRATDSSCRICDKLLAQQDWAGVVSVIRASPYGEAMKADAKRITEEKDYRALSNALDAAYAKTLSELARTTKDPSTKALLQERQDFNDVMLVLRLKPFASKEQVEKQLFGPTISRKVRELIAAPGLDAAIALLQLPEEVVQSYSGRKQLSIIEMSLEKRFFANVLKKFRTNVLSFGVVIGFIYLKTAEVASLKRLALGKYFGVEEDLKPFMLRG